MGINSRGLQKNLPPHSGYVWNVYLEYSQYTNGLIRFIPGTLNFMISYCILSKIWLVFINKCLKNGE